MCSTSYVVKLTHGSIHPWGMPSSSSSSFQGRCRTASTSCAGRDGHGVQPLEHVRPLHLDSARMCQCACFVLFYFCLGSLSQLPIRVMYSRMKNLPRADGPAYRKAATSMPFSCSLVVFCSILVPSYDAIPLELIPMLVGFFTYKAATILQAIQDVMSTIDPSSASGSTSNDESPK